MTVIEKIEKQQGELLEGSAPWVVGEQLKEICKSEPESAAILDQDLDVKEMSLQHAEKKIKAWADEHKTGNFSYVSPQKAEEILRKFYGLPGRQEQQSAAKRDDGIIDIADFI